jgi:tetratricopeptide (TPR) repeat protein
VVASHYIDQIQALRMPSGQDSSALQKKLQVLRAAGSSDGEAARALIALSDDVQWLNTDLALELLREAHEHAVRANEVSVSALALAGSAWVRLARGELQKALADALQGERAAQAAGDYASLRRALYVLASIYQKIGEYTRSEGLWQKLVELARSNRDPLREADYLAGLAALYCAVARHEDSLDSRLRAHTIYASLNDVCLAASFNSVAMGYASLGRFAVALEWVDQAIDRCPALRLNWRIRMLHTKGVCLLELNRIAEANAVLAEALRQVTRSQAPDSNLESEIRVDYARVLYALGESSGAVAELEAALRDTEQSANENVRGQIRQAVRKIVTQHVRAVNDTGLMQIDRRAERLFGSPLARAMQLAVERHTTKKYP